MEKIIDSLDWNAGNLVSHNVGVGIELSNCTREPEDVRVTNYINPGQRML